MRVLSLFIASVLSLGIAAQADAAPVTKALNTAVQRSFAGLKAQDGKGTYKGMRAVVTRNTGKTATANIETFGKRPGPPRIGIQPSTWYPYKTATFKKGAAGWAKQGRWDGVAFALTVGR